MKVKLCQLRPKLGDINKNLDIIKSCYLNSDEDIIIFPELFLSGYPPFDNLMYTEFSIQLEQAIEECKEMTKGLENLVVIGSPSKVDGNWYNSVYLFCNGAIIHKYDKQCLPNYDIFNESRYFLVGDNSPIVEWNNKRLAILICEDIWVNHSHVKYHKNPINECKKSKVDLIIHISASPFEVDKLTKRFQILKDTARTIASPIISVNQVGAYNEIIFDGQSMVINKQGECVFKGGKFKQGELSVDISIETQTMNLDHSLIEEMHDAAIYGLQEYCHHSGFSKVLVGVSGGIDSAIVAALATIACGKENVTCVSMPTKYNSSNTKSDAKALVQNLGCVWHEFPIDIYRTMITSALSKEIDKNELGDITKQNIQARFRGLILMSLANEYNSLLLTTGNKSELAMGYATLYGDMCGGLNIIGDIFKTDVFELAKYINRHKEIIPETIITREPSAELAPDQKDKDSLPEYEILDEILNRYIIEKKSLNELVKLNDKQDVMLVMSKLSISEFKRFQSPPILKLSSRAFGRGWQYPIIR